MWLFDVQLQCGSRTVTVIYLLVTGDYIAGKCPTKPALQVQPRRAFSSSSVSRDSSRPRREDNLIRQVKGSNVGSDGSFVSVRPNHHPTVNNHPTVNS